MSPSRCCALWPMMALVLLGGSARTGPSFCGNDNDEAIVLRPQEDASKAVFRYTVPPNVTMDGEDFVRAVERLRKLFGGGGVQLEADARGIGDDLRALAQAGHNAMFPPEACHHASACALLAVLLDAGLAAPADAAAVPAAEDEAVEWTKLAAAAGHRDALANLGTVHEQGRGAEAGRGRSAAIAARESAFWRALAAQAGDADAAWRLGAMHHSSLLKKEERFASSKVPAKKKTKKKKIKNKNKPAAEKKNLHERSGPEATSDAGEAERWWRAAAEGGHTLAQFDLAALLEAQSSRGGGGGGPEGAQMREAVKWYEEAAAAGLGKAAHALGIIHHQGLGGGGGGLEAAVRWFTEAAELGFSLSAFTLGLLHEAGEAPPEPTPLGHFPPPPGAEAAASAARWYRRAAALGHTTAAVHLGFLFESGEVPPPRPPGWGQSRDGGDGGGSGVGGGRPGAEEGAHAVDWAREKVTDDFAWGAWWGLDEDAAAEQGLREACRWFRWAAERGEARGSFKLGECLLRFGGLWGGLGDAGDLEIEAERWFDIAAAKGYQPEDEID